VLADFNKSIPSSFDIEFSIAGAEASADGLFNTTGK
jgi:hypothetical protein